MKFPLIYHDRHKSKVVGLHCFGNRGSALPATLKLAEAGETDLAETADMASNMLRGFSLAASEMARVGDVLTATFVGSNATLRGLAETMKYVAPIASALGASIEEVSASAGVLGNVGLQDSMAGTALRSLLHGLLILRPKPKRLSMKWE